MSGVLERGFGSGFGSPWCSGFSWGFRSGILFVCYWGHASSVYSSKIHFNFIIIVIVLFIPPSVSPQDTWSLNWFSCLAFYHPQRSFLLASVCLCVCVCVLTWWPVGQPLLDPLFGHAPAVYARCFLTVFVVFPLFFHLIFSLIFRLLFLLILVVGRIVDTLLTTFLDEFVGFLIPLPLALDSVHCSALSDITHTPRWPPSSASRFRFASFSAARFISVYSVVFVFNLAGCIDFAVAASFL